MAVQALRLRLLWSPRVAAEAVVAHGCVLSIPHPSFLLRWLSPSATAVRVACAEWPVLRVALVVLVAIRRSARC